MKDPLHEIQLRADRLMIGALVALFGLTLVLAPQYNTWKGAFLVGLPALAIPLAAMWLAPGSAVSRLIVAAALMVFTALNIHQAYGMVEMHFGVFVLLAFLLCYRDWRPIVLAAAIVAVHHFTFNFFQELDDK